jgi:hypothetical protein
MQVILITLWEPGRELTELWRRGRMAAHNITCKTGITESSSGGTMEGWDSHEMSSLVHRVASHIVSYPYLHTHRTWSGPYLCVQMVTWNYQPTEGESFASIFILASTKKPGPDPGLGKEPALLATSVGNFTLQQRLHQTIFSSKVISSPTLSSLTQWFMSHWGPFPFITHLAFLSQPAGRV